MALPRTEAEMKRAMATIWDMTQQDLSVHTTGFLQKLKVPEPPTLRGWWARQWCAIRGHGGITNYPGSSTYYFHEGLCKRCGDRVNCS